MLSGGAGAIASDAAAEPGKNNPPALERERAWSIREEVGRGLTVKAGLTIGVGVGWGVRIEAAEALRGCGERVSRGSEVIVKASLPCLECEVLFSSSLGSLLVARSVVEDEVPVDREIDLRGIGGATSLGEIGVTVEIIGDLIFGASVCAVGEASGLKVILALGGVFSLLLLVLLLDTLRPALRTRSLNPSLKSAILDGFAPITSVLG